MRSVSTIRAAVRARGLSAGCLLAVAPLLAATAACGDGPRPASRSCAITLDVSASVSADLRARYLDEAGGVIGACVGGRVHVDVADANALAGVCPPVDAVLVTTRSTGNRLYDDAAVRRQATLAREGTARLADCAASHAGDSTDLFGALTAAGGVLHDSAAPKGPRELTVFTDGLSSRAPYDLSARELDPADVNALLDQLSGDRLIADLSGVDVRFVGSGVGVTALDPARQRRLEAAWRAYVNRAGGRLTFYGKTLGSS